MKKYFIEALTLMPEHRARNSRSQSLTLDTLFEEARSLGNLQSSSFDLILMAYRYHHLFERELNLFLKGKSLKPRELKDLLALAFGALLSRDKQAPAVLVSEAVEAVKTAFGAAPVSITNAFLRNVGRKLEKLKLELKDHPEVLLGPVLNKRWAQLPIKNKISQALASRPESGIQGFKKNGEFARLNMAELKAENFFQAMDVGSYNYLKWLETKLSDLPVKARILDACAAPGGKLLLLRELLAAQSKKPSFVATEAKFPRLQRLDENVRRWDAQTDIHTQLWMWGEKSEEKIAELEGPFDLIVADLPCTGSGTLATRPDLLLENIAERLNSLKALQKNILTDLRTRYPGAKLAVSVCSVDPEELGHLSELLGKKPDFSSLEKDSGPNPGEGIVAWLMK